VSSYTSHRCHGTVIQRHPAAAGAQSWCRAPSALRTGTRTQGKTLKSLLGAAAAACQGAPHVGCVHWRSSLTAFDVLEETLSDGREFLVNGEFSVADISVGYATNFLKMIGVSQQDRFLPPCAVTLACCCCWVVAPFVGGPCCGGIVALQQTSWTMLNMAAARQMCPG
jgi:hypothetical protein